MHRKGLRYTAAALGLLLAVTLTGCSHAQESPGTEVTENHGEPEQAPLELSDTTLFLRSGETAVLTANREDAVFAVEDGSVASVGGDGTVTAAGHGVTYVTVSSGDETAVCGVLVDVLGGDSYVNISGKTMKPVVYEKELLKWTILQNWDYVPETGDYFFMQQYDTTPSDDLLTRMYPDGTESYMRFIDAGHGNIISVEYVDDEHIYIWMNANGDVSNAHDSFMRVLWEDGGVIHNDAQTWTLEDMTHNPYVVADAETRIVLVCVKQGTRMTFRLYDMDSMLAGEPVLLSGFQTTVGSDDGSMGYYSFQGLCLDGDYIYFLEGGPGTNIYVSVLDFSGQLLSRELVQGYEDISYREPEGVQVVDGTVYVGIGSGENGNRRANVFALE